MMDYNLKKAPGKPLYEALYNNIKENILDGKLPYDTKLLSKRTLATQLECSITTVENAYQQLLTEGLIRSERAKGFYVCADTSNFSMKIEPEAVKEPYYDLLEQEDAEDEELIDFKANQSSLALFPFSTWTKTMRSVVSSQDPELLKTVPYNGVFALREAIAKYLMRSRGMSVNPAQVIIGAGTEYLYGRLLNLFGPTSVFAIEDPGYKRLADISHQQGTQWRYVPIDKQGILIDGLESSGANIVHVSPANHFPTGTVMSFNRRQELLTWASQSPDRYIIEDDYDSELRFTGKAIPTLFEYDTGNKVIYLNTFSKSLVPSLRISYMVLPVDVLKRYRETLSFYSCTVSSFEQLTLAAFIENGHFERHINRLRKHYRDKRDKVIGAFKHSKLAQISRIEENRAGTHFILRVTTDISDQKLYMLAMEKGVALSMLSDYSYHESDEQQHCIVVNYAGVEEEELAYAIKVLEDVLLPPVGL